MQLIEDTVFGVRSAVLTFEKRGSGVRFVLLPMLHLGSPAFFQATERRLAECDVVIAEGVAGLRTRILTLGYRLGGRFRRDGLIDQGRALNLSSLDAEIVRPDLSASEFATGWRGAPWWLRVIVVGGAPLFGIWMAIVGPRRAIAQRLTVEDEISLEEFERTQGGWNEGLLDARDRNLCQALVRLAHEGSAADRTIGVCWGAKHMRAVTETLHSELGYRVVNAEWVIVF